MDTNVVSYAMGYMIFRVRGFRKAEGVCERVVYSRLLIGDIWSGGKRGGPYLLALADRFLRTRGWMWTFGPLAGSILAVNALVRTRNGKEKPGGLAPSLRT